MGLLKANARRFIMSRLGRKGKDAALLMEPRGFKAGDVRAFTWDQFEEASAIAGVDPNELFSAGTDEEYNQLCNEAGPMRIETGQRFLELVYLNGKDLDLRRDFANVGAAIELLEIARADFLVRSALRFRPELTAYRDILKQSDTGLKGEQSEVIRHRLGRLRRALTLENMLRFAQ